MSVSLEKLSRASSPKDIYSEGFDGAGEVNLATTSRELNEIFKISYTTVLCELKMIG